MERFQREESFCCLQKKLHGPDGIWIQDRTLELIFSRKLRIVHKYSFVKSFSLVCLAPMALLFLCCPALRLLFISETYRKDM